MNIFAYAFLAFLMVATGCSSGTATLGNTNPDDTDPDVTDPDPTDPAPGVNEVVMKAVVANYGLIVDASYLDAIDLAEDLESAINAFVAAPSSTGLVNAKKAWLAAREVYGQTEVYRFYGGPIDDDIDGPEMLINAWPLDEAYIDYVVNPANGQIVQGGLVNDASFTITKANLIGKNAADAEDTITTGYHAIEFLLWGQDRNLTFGGAGVRKYTDFVTGTSGTNLNQARRRTYLKLAGELLVDDLISVEEEWSNSVPNNYRKQMVAATGKEGIRRIIVGMGSLANGELSAQRMEVSLATQDQEDEHSCFSDNTHRDIVLNIQGIINAYEGRYTRPDGTTVGSGAGIKSLIAAIDSDLEASLTDALETAKTEADAISALASRKDSGRIPYDRQILANSPTGNRDGIRRTIAALQDFSEQLSEAAALMGIDLAD